MNDVRGVSIGRAAALYGLAPSTLRWWESQGVLPEPPRVNGRRVYTETELRRVGLAYLCCVIGDMPLGQASVATTGSRTSRWQSTVLGHAERIEEMIKQLQSARAYLLHLARCPDDDVVANCPVLDAELVEHTPRGRFPGSDLVTAAQSLPMRDETRPARDETLRCAVCSGPITQSPRGRRRTYCSRACQQRHYRVRGG
ncbi:MerR family transcriptional regulator [Allokutzneria sp. NRRL B-24872]|uniref:MerR family transcriptional regulator n=1 Tax=Allokutzneria sp. NRRL B-24872 TaxID=1137961 RepID=UPI000A3AF5F6|nr:MerR family transcriptional regulator [Allokutzneria sp. NRRL B-24872]